MQRHYSHVNGFDNFFSEAIQEDSIKSKFGKKIISFASTHPMSEKRISDLEKLITEKQWNRNGELKENNFKK